MEENTTSWKNHSFTLFIFGGIVVLCSIFFVLGMLVGRNQGQKIAETAFREKAANKPVAANVAEGFTLNYDSETVDEKADLPPQPTPPPAPAVSALPVSGASSTAGTKAPPAKTATAKPAAERTPPDRGTQARVPPEKLVWLQVFSTKNEKQAEAEQKRVESKDFKARVLMATLKDGRFYRVLVGPYKDSELKLAIADLKAKGFNAVKAPN